MSAGFNQQITGQFFRETSYNKGAMLHNFLFLSMNVTVMLCVVGMSLCFFLPTTTCRPSYVKQLRSKICRTRFLSVEEIAFRNLEIIMCVWFMVWGISPCYIMS